MFKQILTAFSAAIAISATATPVTLTFENIAQKNSYTSYYSSGFKTHGYSLYLDHGHVFDSGFNPNAYAFNNGTDWLVHDSTGVMLLTQTDGGTFSLSSFLYGSYSWDGSGTFTLTGTRSDNSTISEILSLTSTMKTATLSSAWRNLSKVEFVGSYFQAYDNFVLNDDAPNAVPEPTSLALLGLGLAAIAVMRKRKA